MANRYDFTNRTAVVAGGAQGFGRAVAAEHIQYMHAKIAPRRLVEVDAVAAMIAFRVSEEGSSTTGAVFDISGGRATI